ncbi:MAG: hypothetical protein ACRCXZ_07565 [Patescibacteria group bacterium]
MKFISNKISQILIFAAFMLSALSSSALANTKPADGQRYQIKNARNPNLCLSVDYTKIGVYNSAQFAKVEPCREINEMIFRNGPNNSIALNASASSNLLVLDVDVTKIGLYPQSDRVKLITYRGNMEQSVRVNPVNGGNSLEFGTNGNYYKVDVDVTKIGQYPMAEYAKVVKTDFVNPERTWIFVPIGGTKYTSQFSTFRQLMIGKRVADPNGYYLGECVSLNKRWSAFIGRGYGFYPGNFPLPALNAYDLGDRRMVGNDPNTSRITDVNKLIAGDMVILRGNPSHIGIATGVVGASTYEILEQNAPVGGAVRVFSYPKSSFYGAIRYN